jgi:Kef-type K+ transport system membrane component KefB
VLDQTFFVIILIGVIEIVGIIAINLWIIVPKAFQLLEQWRKNKNPRCFSCSIFCFFAAFSLFSLALRLMIKSSLQIESLVLFRYGHLAISVLMALVLIYVFIPKTLFFFEKWRSTKKTVFCSIFLLFAFISTYIMLFIYILNTPAFLR